MKILFVCHGNICRSPMAEFVMKDLDRHGIPYAPRRAWLLDAAKAAEYDLIIGMDAYNMADLRRLVYPADLPKVRRLLDFAGVKRDVADPWYTGNFDETYADIIVGCTAILRSFPARASTPPVPSLRK